MSTCDNKNVGTCEDIGDTTSCSEFELSNNTDGCIIDNYTEEHLNIGGAPINVFKLLGVHEQGTLLDLAKNGEAISSGINPHFPPLNAFKDSCAEWRSVQRGSGVVASAYLGYNFGYPLIDNGRRRYGIDTGIKVHVTTLKIQQGSNSINRITKARIERSADGQKWFGVDIVSLVDDELLHTYSIKESAPNQYWRIRPLEFNGGDNNVWAIKQLQLIDYSATNIKNIQDSVFLENRDRDYAEDSIRLKATYDLVEAQSDLSKFGLQLPSQIFNFTVHFNACVRTLGRPLVIGDIIELPSEQQYTPDLKAIKKYLEVTDITWDAQGYTPGWKPTLLKVTAQPMLATQETEDIFGDLDRISISNTTKSNIDSDIAYQDIFNIHDTIVAESDDNQRERGIDTADLNNYTEEQVKAAEAKGYDLDAINARQNALYVQDGMPPNGHHYTEGDEYPLDPEDGAWHRLTYNSIDSDLPVQLYRFSANKNRWIYMETDRRKQFNHVYPTKQQLLEDPEKKSTSKYKGK